MKMTVVGAIMYISIFLYIIGNLQSFAELGLFPYIAAICLPVIICGWIYERYKKLYDKLEKIEKQLEDKDKANEDTSSKRKEPKN